jgi:nitrogen PTS system EIIA component
MDLKIKDVAELLNISETTVRRWLTEGKIPAYKLNRQYRFSRTEIEDWIMQQKLQAAKELRTKEEGATQGNRQFSLYRALNHGQVFTFEAETKAEVIAQTMLEMSEQYDLDPHVLTDLFLDREKMMSTGLGEGVAVPHSRDFLLDTHFDVVNVVYLKKPMDYNSLDGVPVHTLFFLFASEDRHHLNLLAKVAHFTGKEECRDFLQTRPSKEKLMDFVKEWEGGLNT